MVAGSFASSVHGKPRTTQDLDLVIDVDRRRVEIFIASLPKDEWYADLDVAVDAGPNVSGETCKAWSRCEETIWTVRM